MTHRRRRILRWLLSGFLLPVILSLGLLPGCSESLPTRIVPQDTLSIAYVFIGQGTNAGGIHVSIAINVENVYEETFIGTVDVTGNIRISWPRHPDVVVNLPIRRRQTDLHLDPSDAYIVDALWFLRTDDGRSVMDLLDFSSNDVRHGVQYAEPETFLFEVTMTLFEETGLLTSGPHEFVLEGWKTLDDSTGIVSATRLPPRAGP